VRTELSKERGKKGGAKSFRRNVGQIDVLQDSLNATIPSLGEERRRNPLPEGKASSPLNKGEVAGLDAASKGTEEKELKLLLSLSQGGEEIS